MSGPTPGDRFGEVHAIVDPGDGARYRKDGWWGDLTVSDWVRHHGFNRPDAVAYVDDSGSTTWSEFDRWADHLAAQISGAGLNPGGRLGIWMEDSTAIHAAFVAAERAGVTVVGIGHRAGPTEVAHLLRSTGADVLMTDALHRDRPAGVAVGEVLALADDLASLTHLIVNPPPTTQVEPRSQSLGPDDLFLINSTSGTTGLPKCVLHHQNRWMYFHLKAVEHAALKESDVFYGAVPAPFGFGLWTAHVTPIVLGATVAISARFDAGRALDQMIATEATVLGCVSTQLNMLVDEIDRRGPASAPRLRVVFTGGEAVPADRCRRFEELTGATVLQFYGSNETGLLSGTVLGDDLETRLSTAGRVVEEMQVRLFDEGADVTASGRGQPGCRGPATTVGYLDQSANDALFTSDGWMLMGDICTIDSESRIRVVGRLSDFIIRGGKNISAVRVEEEVSSHPGIAEVAAVPVPDPVFGERVCVCVKPRPGAEVLLGDLVEHMLARGVSKELLPERLLIFDELPRSSGGKIAKGDLRRLATERVQSGSN